MGHIDNETIQKLWGKKIKFAKEDFYDVPEDWTDEQIENQLWRQNTYPYGPTMWCHYDEQLFDNPHIGNPNYVEKPIPKGHKRVRVARQKYRYTNGGWFLLEDNVEDAITNHIRCCGITNSPTFIWCWGDEELFKE